MNVQNIDVIKESPEVIKILQEDYRKIVAIIQSLNEIKRRRKKE